ncbi:CGNR zinc finger domain-containing protein [Kitasatospora sp. NPDC056327]|uniref:CGNR zinc finger domain-containing protein n=1 Tax=Kitasatospora sp. NPDC056327 TaxID=3345785 RepID=UPI0035E35868
MTDERTPGLVLHSPGGTRFHFDPGTLCLELLPTGGPGPYTRYEVLHRPDDLADWAGRCRLGLPSGTVRITDEQLAAVRALRDALWRLTAARANGDGPGDPDDYEVVNRAAAHAPLAPRISPDGTAADPLPGDGDQLASTVARDAIALFTGPYADRVRECGADNCSLLFVDTSRPGRRRWCSMERCGNRHKVRALRARRDRPEGAGASVESGGTGASVRSAGSGSGSGSGSDQ